MKKVMRSLLAALTLTTMAFAQDEGESVAAEATDTQVATEAADTQVAAEPAKPEEKSAFHMDKRPDPVWGIRLGAHMAGINGQTLSFGWHLGGAFYLAKFFDLSLGGDILGLKMFLEPNLLFVSKTGWEGTNQYWLEAPVMANFMFTVFSFRFKYSVGPYAAVGLFGDFDKVLTADDIREGNTEGSKVGRFDVGFYNTLGYEWAKNIWSDFTLGLGFIDMVDKQKGSTNFMIKCSAGVDF